MPEGEMLLGPATAEVLAASRIGLGHGAGGTCHAAMAHDPIEDRP
jgi:hypothetical protein